MKNFKFLILTLAICFLALGTSVSADMVNNWQDNTSTPPANNAHTPINVGETDQTKEGGLTLENFLFSSWSGVSKFLGKLGVNTSLIVGDSDDLTGNLIGEGVVIDPTYGSGNPTIILKDSVRNWYIDNNSGGFRIFREGFATFDINGTNGNVDIKKTLQVRGDGTINNTPSAGEVISSSDGTGASTWKTLNEVCAQNPAGCTDIGGTGLPGGDLNDTLRYGDQGWQSNNILTVDQNTIPQLSKTTATGYFITDSLWVKELAYLAYNPGALVGIGKTPGNTPTAKLDIDQTGTGVGLSVTNTSGTAQQNLISNTSGAQQVIHSTPTVGNFNAQLLLKTGAAGTGSDWRLGTWTGLSAADPNAKDFYIFDGVAAASRIIIDGITGNTTIKKQVKIEGGTPGAGKVLQSDATGLATWVATSTLGISSLPTGAINETLRHDGTNWVSNSILKVFSGASPILNQITTDTASFVINTTGGSFTNLSGSSNYFAGSLGLGVTPDKKLDISVPASDGVRIKRTDNSTGLGINMGNAAPWVDFVGSVSFVPTTYSNLGNWVWNTTSPAPVLFKIDGASNVVTVGTSTSAARLDVNGNIKSASTTGDNVLISPSNGGHPRITLTNDVGGNWNMDNQAGLFRIFDTAARLTIDNTGLVTMPTTTVSSQFRLTGSQNTAGLGKVVADNGVGNGTAKWKTLNEVCADNPAGCTNIVGSSLPGGTVDQTLRYDSTAPAGWKATGALKVTSAGNVGVGLPSASSPLATLHVNGQILSSGATIANAVPTVTFDDLDSGTRNWNINNNGGFFGITNDLGKVAISIKEDGDTAGSPRVTIGLGDTQLRLTGNKMSPSGTTPDPVRILTGDTNGLAVWKNSSDIPGLGGSGLPVGLDNQTLYYDTSAPNPEPNSNGAWVPNSLLENNGSNLVVKYNIPKTSGAYGPALSVTNTSGNGFGVLSTDKIIIKYGGSGNSNNRPEPGDALVAENANGDTDWVPMMIMTATAIKNPPTGTGLFDGPANWNTGFSYLAGSNTGIDVTEIEDNNWLSGLFGTNRDVVKMACPSGYNIINTYYSCSSGFTRESYPGETLGSWYFGCGNKLANIDIIHASCGRARMP